MIMSISIVITLLLLTALEAQHSKGFCLKTHSETEAAQRKALSPASCSARGDPPRSCSRWQTSGSELVLSLPPTSEQLQRDKPLLPLGAAQPCGGKRGLFGTRVSTFIELSTNSRKTCEAANGIMVEVFIFQRRPVRIWGRLEVSLLLARD